MSVYGIRRDRWLDDDPHWERIMQKAVSAPPPRAAHLGEPEPAQDGKPHPAQGGARLRKVDPVNYLLPASSRWLNSLPREVQPLALATKYARIVNLLARHWNDHDACAAFFNHLLLDHRGNRQGFPVAVKSEIRILQEYFLYSTPKAVDRSTIGR